MAFSPGGYHAHVQSGKNASDFRETSSRIVRDFLGGQYKPFSELVSICTVADVACTKEQAKAMSKTLCELWKQADIRGITFRYDDLEDSEAARFTLRRAPDADGECACRAAQNK